MGEAATIQEINSILEDRLYQVIGSTPQSLAEAVKKSTLKNNPKTATKFISICIFAATVNKQTMETFLSEPRFTEIRQIVSAQFSIQGKPNMAGMSLAGHCMMLSTPVSKTKYATEYRVKLGQRSIWDGDLGSTSVSEKQKKILLEKSRIHDRVQAEAFGNGYCKYTGIIREAMTRAEAAMWGAESTDNRREETTMTPPVPPKRLDEKPVKMPSAEPIPPTGFPGLKRSRHGQQSSSGSGKEDIYSKDPVGNVVISGHAEEVNIPEDVYNYLAFTLGRSDEAIITSISGKEDVENYFGQVRRLMAVDPDGSKAKGKSVIG